MRCLDSPFVFYVLVVTIHATLQERISILPVNWRELLTDNVLSYHIKRTPLELTFSKFEGDILGIDRFTSPASAASLGQNAVVDREMLWQNGIIPYDVSEAFTSSQRGMIEEALRDMMSRTCLRFVPRSSEKDFVSFVNRAIGLGGQQFIDLMPGCLTFIGEIQHEVLHALGFFHEQSRSDRDRFVTILWDNVIPGTEPQFNTYRTDNLDMDYDYESVMHYGWNYFAKDRTKPTILPKVARKTALGNREKMSSMDVEKINRLYSCSTKIPSGFNRSPDVIERPLLPPPNWNRGTMNPISPERNIPGNPPKWNSG